MMQRRQHQATGSKGARQRMRGTGLHQIRASGDDPALRAAHQLVAAERHQIGAGSQRLTGGRFAVQPTGRAIGQPRTGGVQQTRADVGHHRHAERRQFVHRGLLDETLHAIVGRVHLQHHGDVVLLVCDGLAIVVQTRAIGGAHVDQARSGLLHHLGHAEATTDFDALTTADGHVASAGERGQHQHHRGGVVVHHHGILGAARQSDESTDALLTTAALSGAQIEFQVLGARVVMEGHGGTAEVGVGDHAGAVDHGHQQRVGGVARDALGASRIAAGDGSSGGVHQQRMRQADVGDGAGQRVDTGGPRGGRVGVGGHGRDAIRAACWATERVAGCWLG